MSDERTPLWDDDRIYEWIDPVKETIFITSGDPRTVEVVSRGEAEALAMEMRDDYEAAIAAAQEWEPVADGQNYRYLSSYRLKIEKEGEHVTLESTSGSFHITFALPNYIRIFKKRKDAGDAA